MEYTGFIPIAAIFYAVFHPEEGTKIVYQVPSDAISTGSRDNAESLFNFDTVKNYVIPKAQLCNKLISFKINNYRVIGFPVNIENATYARNTFNFNFCFVFPYDVGDVTPYESPIKRMGTMFKVLEEQSFLLSKLDDSNSFYKHTPETSGPAISAPGHARTTSIKLSSIESLIAQIYSDLNNYCECCIPLDSANSVDIKLFPILPPPVNIKAYQVPIATVKLHTLVDSTSDPAMIQIVPHINGLNSIRRISELSQADYMLTKQCIQHLMHYKCIELIDIFQFSNVYATTNHIGNFLRDDGRMAEECQAYVVTDYGVEQLLSPTAQSQINSVSPGSHSHHYFSSRVSGTTPGTPSHPIKVPSKSTLFALYRKLNQGMTVKEWYLENRHQLESIDVRRFINFGVVRRIIYRVHSFPLLNSITRAIEKDEFYELTESSVRKKSDSAMVVPTPAPKNRTVTFNKPSHKHATQSDSDSVYSSDLDDEDLVEDEEEVLVRKQSTKSSVDESHDGEMRDLFKMLKGFQPFDSICTVLQKSRREVEAMVQQFGSYNIANS
ncbi:nitrogen permease regulator 2 [Diutina catenulata]